ncbi:hypothetical protein EG827_09210, partial [bacterium]|nr:hypothetical protein [bacterium]
MKTNTDFKSYRLHRHLVLGIVDFMVLSVILSYGQIDTADRETEGQETTRRYLSLFEENEILEVSLSMDVSMFLKKADRDQALDAIMTMHFSETDSMERKVVVRYRGQSRYERCRYPPAQITFKKPVYEVSDSGRIKKIKLVNQCQAGGNYENFVIREYLVYKLYGVLTDTCYRARLVRLNLIDSEKKRKPITQYGILIEPDELLESRLNIMEVKSHAVSQRHMYPAMIDRIAIFNYMVSNWDWSVPGQHNISVFTSKNPDEGGRGIPVPFDFDLTGVVNAEYAIPPPGIGIETNRDRLFLGICRTREEFYSDLMEFLAKKDEFYSLVNNMPYLSN